MIELIAKTDLQEARLFGFIPISWESACSVDFEDTICRFDFKHSRVLAVENDKVRNIGEIIGCKEQKKIRNFQGEVRVGDYHVIVNESLFSYNIELRAGSDRKHLIERVKNNRSIYVLGDSIEMCEDYLNNRLLIQCKEEFRDLAFVVGAIVFHVYGVAVTASVPC